MRPELGISVLHVEVGGSYGGSLKALQSYLVHSERQRFRHDLLLYYPTPGGDDLAPYVGRILTLHPKPRAGQRSPSTSASALRRRLRSLSAKTVFSGLLDWRWLASDLPNAGLIHRVLRRGGYDVVHVNNTFTYQPATLVAARVAKKPVLGHVRNPVEQSAFSRWAMRTLTHVATVNRALESELNGWGVPIPVSTCHDGVDLPAPDESVSSALRASLLAEPGFLVGSVGRLDPQKDYQNFVLAARLVLDKCPNVRFAVAGEGPLRLSLENLIARLGLKGRFHLCGFRPDVVNFLAALDVFVLSSRWEGLPLAVLEAMLLGKPVVATNVGGNAEVIGPPLTGQIVPPADPNALAEAVLKVLDLKNAGMHSPRETRRIAAAFSDPIRNARMLDDIVERLGTSSSCSESCRVWQSDQLPPTLPL